MFGHHQKRNPDVGAADEPSSESAAVAADYDARVREQQVPQRVRVSLIATVKNEADHILPFLDSVARQTRKPDEFVVVDGGSTDGTLEALQAAEGLTLIEEPGANIAGGRNIAIAAAAHDIIAVTDGDCVLEPDWLERLIRQIDAGADVAMGAYRGLAGDFLETCMACANLPDLDRLDEAAFMPSARSVGFRREAMELVGGYPEWLDIGEDMWVNHRWRELGLDMRLARDAVVWWRSGRPTLGNWHRYFSYARGDAIAGMYPGRHTIRFAVYGGALFAWRSKSLLAKCLTIVGGFVYAAKPLRRAMARLAHPGDRAKAVLVVPVILAFLDSAKMAGYLSGLIARSRQALTSRLRRPL
jgi:glycosyltransferase involved in cell wall biosynthesis